VPLQQVFMNLVGNAVKYGDAANPRIEITTQRTEGCHQFSVRDNGPGIAPQYHDRVWQIFQTLAARDKVEGTGIGLSVVRKIVEARGGHAWLESDVGRGATFHFTWPDQPRTAP
jgi:signal transduction histidine kinase